MARSAHKICLAKTKTLSDEVIRLNKVISLLESKINERYLPVFEYHTKELAKEDNKNTKLTLALYDSVRAYNGLALLNKNAEELDIDTSEWVLPESSEIEKFIVKGEVMESGKVKYRMKPKEYTVDEIDYKTQLAKLDLKDPKYLRFKDFLKTLMTEEEKSGK